MAAPRPSRVKLSEIKTKLLRPALTSHYICDFQPPASADGFLLARVLNTPTKRADRLSLACSDASLPGSSLQTHDITNDFTGVTEKHAYRRLYDDRADFSFYVDAEEYYVIDFFESWIGYTVNEQYGENGVNIKRREYNYRVNYSKYYTTDALSITKFERSYGTQETKGSSSLRYNFVKAFPISINSMPVSYDSSQLLKCTVSFTYSRYWIQGLNLRGKTGEPRQTPGTGAPKSQFDITPQKLAEVNSNFGFTSNVALSKGNISPGTVFDTQLRTQSLLDSSAYEPPLRDIPLF
jgi:hypothetical protein